MYKSFFKISFPSNLLFHNIYNDIKLHLLQEKISYISPTPACGFEQFDYSPLTSPARFSNIILCLMSPRSYTLSILLFSQTVNKPTDTHCDYTEWMLHSWLFGGADSLHSRAYMSCFAHLTISTEPQRD